MPEFGCGCRALVVHDDSHGEEYPSSPSILFEFERCTAHSLDALNPGPIGQWMAEYADQHPMVKGKHVEPPPAPPKVKGCGRGNHDYQRVPLKRYGRCSKCPSTRTNP